MSNSLNVQNEHEFTVMVNPIPYILNGNNDIVFDKDTQPSTSEQFLIENSGKMLLMLACIQNNLSIDEPIDNDLREEVGKLLTNAVDAGIDVLALIES